MEEIKNISALPELELYKVNADFYVVRDRREEPYGYNYSWIFDHIHSHARPIKDTDKIYFTRGVRFPVSTFNQVSTGAKRVINRLKATVIVMDARSGAYQVVHSWVLKKAGILDKVEEIAKLTGGDDIAVLRLESHEVDLLTRRHDNVIGVEAVRQYLGGIQDVLTEEDAYGIVTLAKQDYVMGLDALAAYSTSINRPLVGVTLGDVLKHASIPLSSHGVTGKSLLSDFGILATFSYTGDNPFTDSRRYILKNMHTKSDRLVYIGMMRQYIYDHLKAIGITEEDFS